MCARRYLRFPWLLVGLALAACAGGSGSSGFDENAAIQQALDTQSCVRRLGLDICPTDQPPAATPQPRVDTGGIDHSGSIACLPSPGSATCAFTLPFAPQGFPTNAVFRVAVRTDTSGLWTIGGELPPEGTPAAPTFDAPVSLAAPPGAAGNGVAVQLAVLVFLDPAAAVSGDFDQLAATHADDAFVTSELTVRLAP